MIDIVIIVVLVVIAAAIGFYLYRAKRRGQTCIGCPHARECGQKHSCGCDSEKK